MYADQYQFGGGISKKWPRINIKKKERFRFNL